MNFGTVPDSHLTVDLAGAAGPAAHLEIKDGDHRLSRDEDLRRIATALDRVLQQVRGDG
jgi:hypothetical protein